MSFHKRICSSLLNENSENDIPSILLVGDLEENLEKIAMQLLNEADFHRKVVKVNTANKLPLLGKDPNEIVFISLIIFLVDVSNKESLLSIKQSLKFLPIEFFMGRLLFVGLNAADENRRCVEPDEIVALADECDFCPILWMDSSTAANKSTLSQILKKLQLSTAQDLYTSSMTTNIPSRY